MSPVLGGWTHLQVLSSGLSSEASVPAAVSEAGSSTASATGGSAGSAERGCSGGPGALVFLFPGL